MEVRYTIGKNEYKRMTTQELRDAFVNTTLCEKGKVNLMYCEVERGIAGFAVPTTKALSMPAGKEIASEYFCERRELGVLNVGGGGAPLNLLFGVQRRALNEPQALSPFGCFNIHPPAGGLA